MPDFCHETGGKLSIFTEIVVTVTFGRRALQAIPHGYPPSTHSIAKPAGKASAMAFQSREAPS
jgi:hypothetical protein